MVIHDSVRKFGWISFQFVTMSRSSLVLSPVLSTNWIVSSSFLELWWLGVWLAFLAAIMAATIAADSMTTHVTGTPVSFVKGCPTA